MKLILKKKLTHNLYSKMGKILIRILKVRFFGFLQYTFNIQNNLQKKSTQIEIQMFDINLINRNVHFPF